MSYATISDISRRWQVDRATARTALQRGGVDPCDLFKSPRFRWEEVLRKIEAWPAAAIAQIDPYEQLAKAEEMADSLGVTTQTVRNYGRAGRLYRIEITPRAVRYLLPSYAKIESEGNNDDLVQK